MNRNKSIRRSNVFIMSLALILLACQGVGSFNPFATATPTPTATFTPTPTFTITPSPTATATQAPTATPRPTGIAVEEQTSGESLVTDYDNNYQFLLPSKWKVVFSTQEDLQQAIDFVRKKDPEYAKMVESFKDVDPDIFRLVAVNIDRKYVSSKFPSALTINAFNDPLASSMPMEFVTAMIEDNILKGATSTSWDVISNANKVEVATVRGIRTITAPNGIHATVAELVIAFRANKKLVVIEIATPKEFKEAILKPFDNIIDSIKVNQ